MTHDFNSIIIIIIIIIIIVLIIDLICIYFVSDHGISGIKPFEVSIIRNNWTLRKQTLANPNPYITVKQWRLVYVEPRGSTGSPRVRCSEPTEGPRGAFVRRGPGVFSSVDGTACSKSDLQHADEHTGGAACSATCGLYAAQKRCVHTS